MESLLAPGLRFVNRDPDSGTRQLFDHLLAQHHLRGAQINGYEQVEYTHAAVASYVASGMADVAFGVEAAASQFGLQFIRVLTEDYFFVCRKEILEIDAVKRMLEIMRGEAFAEAISTLPGYRIKDPGAIKTIGQVFRRAE